MITIEWFEHIKKNMKKVAQSPKGFMVMCIICFLEPIILPIFPELVLAPVLLARKKERFKIVFSALVCTLLGALLAYTIGYYLGKVLISHLGEHASSLYMKGQLYLNYYGAFLPLIGSVLPFPLKVISWTCGLTHFNVIIFMSAVAVGRLARYSLLLLLNKIPSKKIVEKK